jgi:hypothetical protein
MLEVKVDDRDFMSVYLRLWAVIVRMIGRCKGKIIAVMPSLCLVRPQSITKTKLENSE